LRRSLAGAMVTAIVLAPVSAVASHAAAAPTSYRASAGPTSASTSVQISAVSTDPMPVGGAFSGTLVWRDEFDGATLDASRWSSMEGHRMNNVTTRAANVAVSGGNLILTLSSATEGAFVSSCACDGAGSNAYLLPTNAYVEARVYFPGDSTTHIYNWPAWWTSGPNWPAAGEHDIAEGLGGELTVNYHGTTNAQNLGAILGTWQNTFHTFGLWRKATSASVYWDGTLVQTYPTGDDGAAESLLINVGSSGTAVTGAASQVKVDYVRAWEAAGG
jgi:hypothetical protein